MLRFGVLFLVLAIICGALGYTGIAGQAWEMGRILLFVFLVLAVVSIVMNSLRGGSARDLV